ncbi:hypothetical protein, partial [Actinocorallia lasiicapitis]
GAAIGEPLEAHQGGLTAALLRAGPGGLRAITGDQRGGVRIWDLRERVLTAELTVPGGVRALAMDGAGRLLVAFGVDVAVFTPDLKPDLTSGRTPRT